MFVGKCQFSSTTHKQQANRLWVVKVSTMEHFVSRRYRHRNNMNNNQRRHRHLNRLLKHSVAWSYQECIEISTNRSSIVGIIFVSFLRCTITTYAGWLMPYNPSTTNWRYTREDINIYKDSVEYHVSVAVIINQKRKWNASDRLFEYDDGSPMMGMRSKTTQWSGGSVRNINAQSIYYVVR